MTKEEKTEYYYACLLSYESTEFKIMMKNLGLNMNEKTFQLQRESLQKFVDQFNTEETKKFHDMYLIELEKNDISERAWNFHQESLKENHAPKNNSSC